MTAFEWTDAMGEISGFGADNPGYEAACRRMVIAGAEWIAEHPDAKISYGVLALGPGVIVTGSWPDIIRPETPHAHALIGVMDRAAKADLGNEPSALMMDTCLKHVRYIGNNGWDAYAKVRAEK